MTDSTGKPCPKCHAPMSDLRSMHKRICTDCGSEWDWELSQGQAPLVGTNRAGRRKKKPLE